MQSIVSLFTTYLPYFILVLTLLVFVHEFGHYWVGRRFGIHAEVFSGSHQVNRLDTVRLL